MFKISQRTLKHLSGAIQRQNLEERIWVVNTRIHKLSAAGAIHLPEGEILQGIRETIIAAERYGIDDFEDQCQWAYIRLVTGHKFWENPHFSHFLDDPLFHAKSKGRNIITAFLQAVKNANQEG
ncbi:MAG TPA: hypothetical protein VKY85_10690 [Candidatus Angelobacter sp.]|nr:hypothetical protein [Candidatus Angelobacter sp.]